MTEKAFWIRLFWWTLYAASFGYVEALVVVYIRRLGEMPPGLDYPAIWAAHGLPWNGVGIIAEMKRLGVYGRSTRGRSRPCCYCLARRWRLAGQAANDSVCFCTRLRPGTRHSISG